MAAVGDAAGDSTFADWSSPGEPLRWTGDSLSSAGDALSAGVEDV